MNRVVKSSEMKVKSARQMATVNQDIEQQQQHQRRKKPRRKILKGELKSVKILTELSSIMLIGNFKKAEKFIFINFITVFHRSRHAKRMKNFFIHI
jgi:hypothetical protein